MIYRLHDLYHCGGLRDIYCLLGFADYCLYGDTLVYTKEFGYQKISKIVDTKLDCTIYSVHNNSILEQKISQYWSKGLKYCYEYELENSTTITCTSDHKFLTKNNTMQTIENIYKNNFILDLKELK